MTRFTLVSAVLYVVGSLIVRFAPTSLFGVLEGVGLAGLLISLGYYGFRFLRWLKRLLFWKVRNKIIVSFAFVGIIPVLILAFISWFSFTLIFRQLSALYLESEIQAVTETLRHVSEQILLKHYREAGPPRERLDRVLEEARETFVRLSPGLENLELTVVEALEFQDGTRSPAASGKASVSPGNNNRPSIPGWAQRGFTGLTRDPKGLFFRSVLPVEGLGTPHFIYLELPFDQRLRRYVQERTSIDLHLFSLDENADMTLWDFLSSEEGFSRIRWIHILRPVEWAGHESRRSTSQEVLLAVPWQRIYNHLFEFTQTSDIGQFLFNLILALGVVFVVVEIVSLFVGVAIARSITRSIYNLHAGTRSLLEGKFDFRIPTRNRDQLDDVAARFNHMAENIVALMRQVSEKERLEQEIGIAREVQARLFPQRLPSLDGLEVAAACYPARHVSGDYYDFITYGDQGLGVIIADISGKGISAALLMASLQSCIRTLSGVGLSGRAGKGQIAAAVAEINRQLYHQTAADKFATLIFGHFDAATRTFSYCNAGHNPPLWIARGEATRLTRGGTVVGLFETWEYEEETLTLSPGDLVVLYTDGIVEAEDSQGEQFSEARLVELVTANSFLTAEDLQNLVFHELSRWTGTGERDDDVTLVILKG